MKRFVMVDPATQLVNGKYDETFASIPVGAIEVSDTVYFQISDDGGDWKYDGSAFSKVAGASSGPVVDDYMNAVQGVLDSYAANRGYQDGTTLSTYDSSSIAAWSAEARAFINWRDACWLLAYGMLQQVNAGKIPQPTVAALIAALPAHP